MSYFSKVAFVITMISGHSLSASEIGVFVIVKRGVKVKKANGTEQKAKKTMNVFEGDTVITAAQGRAKIQMNDRNIINVSPNTTLKMAKYVDRKNVELHLDEGKVRNEVKNRYNGKDKKFIIKTPTAVAGVRGTDFLTSFNKPKKKTEVITFSGRVEFSSLNAKTGGSKPVVVRKGHSSSSEDTKPPSPPKQVPKGQLNEMKMETGFQPAKGAAVGGDTGAAAKMKETMKSADTLENTDDVKQGLGGANMGKQRPQYQPPKPTTRNLPADAIRNQNQKTRVIINPQSTQGTSNK